MEELTYLRALEVSDLDRIHRWHNDKELYELLGGPFRFVSKQATEAWLGNKTDFSSYRNDERTFAICLRDTNEHVGNIYLHEINWIARHARLELFIGEAAQRSKGYGRSAIRQILSYARYDLGLKKIYLNVLTDNPTAMHVYEALGFRAEGRLRDHVFKKGSWKDVIYMEVFLESRVSGEEIIQKTGRRSRGLRQRKGLPAITAVME